MNLTSDDISQWGESLDDFLPEYKSVRCWDTIQCYQLQGRKTTLLLDNFEPIPALRYALYSPTDKRYYFKEFPDIPLWLMCFYRTNDDWDSYDAFLNDFRRRTSDGNIYLLLTPEQITNTSDMLRRLWKSSLDGEGKLDYKIYIQLANLSIKYEDYKDKCKSLTGFKTCCNQFDMKIAALWKSAHELKS